MVSAAWLCESQSDWEGGVGIGVGIEGVELAFSMGTFACV